MFVDASAIVAIAAPEPDGPTLAARLTRASLPRPSALAVYEATLGLARPRTITVDDARLALDEFLQVEASNTAGRALCDSVGMTTELHRYHYRRAPIPALNE
jgi:uncharacterized protein with PIN domain